MEKGRERKGTTVAVAKEEEEEGELVLWLFGGGESPSFTPSKRRGRETTKMTLLLPSYFVLLSVVKESCSANFPQTELKIESKFT